MTAALILVSVLAAIALGVAVWLGVLRARVASEVIRLQAELAHRAEVHRRELDASEALHRERLEGVERARERLAVEIEQIEKRSREAFGALAASTLKESTDQFLKLAESRFGEQHARGKAELEQRRQAFEQLVKPIGETLKQTDDRLRAFERTRSEAFGKLEQQLRDVSMASLELRSETGKLVRALREPHVRGRYGEIQLQRVAELAGMSAYCDFSTQETSRDQDGNLLRPDMVVRLPNDRVIAVDAKTNIRCYLEALEATSEEQAESHLAQFAQHVVDQAAALGKKNYWKEHTDSPEFVVMFIPGDQFLDAALSRRPDLLDFAAQRRVIMASPSTLIGLLRAVAVGWRERKVAEDALELRELGETLHDRARVAFNHAAELGDSLRRTVDSYNRFVGSVESRLVPTLRKFEESGVKSQEPVRDLPEVTVTTRHLESAEATPLPAGDDDADQGGPDGDPPATTDGSV